MLQEIFNRRSIRRFSPQPLTKEQVETLVGAAMQAPSGKNVQPWEFLIVDDPDMRIKLSKTHPYAGAAKNAPTVILLLCNMAAYLSEDDRFWQQDMAAAAENILLAAQSMGLGSVWLGLAPLQERMEYVRQAFALPEGIMPFAMFPVGYPLKEKPPENRFDEKRIFYGTYG